VPGACSAKPGEPPRAEVEGEDWWYKPGMATRERVVQEREAVRARFGSLFEQVSAALFGDDPIGINFGTNTNEYEPEVGTILPRLETCTSASDVARVVHEEFAQWFGAATAGPRDRYENVAQVIWRLWEDRKQPST
jgi:hypothetical protein